MRLVGWPLQSKPRLRVDERSATSNRAIKWLNAQEDFVQQRACFLLFVFALAAAAQAPKSQYAPTHWPISNGSFDIPNFRFGTGEMLPNLHLHYLTLGTLHRDSEGHADNAVLLLHGTGGSSHSLLNAAFSDVLFGGPAA
jgi:hypothetical protein